MRLKRLRDVTNKRIAYVEGSEGQACQLWVDMSTMKMYYYNRSQWIEYTQNVVNDGKTYGRVWEVINSDDEMGVYDTNEPTDLFLWEDGDEVSYVFKDWNGTVLKEGKVKEGTKPTAPADPTRTGYTFTGWNPTVAKITKKTTYTATYEINTYTVTVSSNDDTYGTVDVTEIEADYGAAISASDNVLTIGSTTITATAESGYIFSSWGTLPSTVTSDLTITATFEQDVYITINQVTSDTTGYVGGQVTVYYESNGTGFLMSDNPDIMEAVSDAGVYGSSTVFNVLQAGTTTLTITAIKNGRTASDTIQIVCSNPAPTIPANAVVLNVEKDEDTNEWSWNSANIFQIGPGYTSGNSTSYKPRGPDYIAWDGTTATPTGAYVSDAHMTALAGDSDMMGYINTAISGIIAAINDFYINVDWDSVIGKGYIFFAAAYWTALNTYFSASNPDLATLKSTFATLIGNSTPMFSGYEDIGTLGMYAPYEVEAEYDLPNDMTTVKIFKDDRGDYIQFRTTWNGQGGYAVTLDKRDSNVGAVMKTILNESWGGTTSQTSTYKSNMETAFIDMAEEIKDKMGVSTMSGVYASWNGTFDTSNTYFFFEPMTVGLFNTVSVSAVNSYMENLHQNAGNLFESEPSPAPVLNIPNSVNITDLHDGDSTEVRANLFQLGSGKTNELPAGTSYLEKTGSFEYSKVGDASYLDWLYSGISYCHQEIEDGFDAIVGVISNAPDFDWDFELRRNFNVFFSPEAWSAIQTYMAAEGVETPLNARRALQTALRGLTNPIFCGNIYGYGGLSYSLSHAYIPVGVRYDETAHRVSFCIASDNSSSLAVEIHDGDPVLVKYDNSVGAIMKSILDGTWGGSQADIATYKTNLEAALLTIYNDAVTALGNNVTPGEFNNTQDILNPIIRQMYGMVTALQVNVFAIGINTLSNGGTSVVVTAQS